MKTILSLLITIIAGVAVAQDGNYIQFPESNAYWRESSGGYQCNCCYEYQYTIEGDTIINNIKYQKLFWSGAHYQDDLLTNCNYSHSLGFSKYLFGGLRNDIPSRRVWFLPANSNYEQLLYDFSLEVGDTVPPLYITREIYDPFIVSAIDSVEVGQSYRRAFKISFKSPENYVASFVEGIGSEFGLFGSMGAIGYIAEFGSILKCFHNDDIEYPEYADCSLATSRKEINREELSIIPNPANDYFTINNNSQLNINLLTITDLQGRIYHEYRDIHTGEAISCLNLKPGIYILRLETKNNKLIYRKLIIH